MKVTDFNSYALLQEHKTYILDNADKLREYLQLNNKWRNVIAHTLNTDDPLFDAAAGIVHKVDKEQPISFNPDTLNGAAHIFMLDAFVTAGDLTGGDKTAILALATQSPLGHITEPEFDATHAELTLKENPTIALANSVTEDVDNKPYILNGAKGHKITITVASALPYDDVFTVTASDKNNDDAVYGYDGKPRGTIRLPANQTKIILGSEEYDPSNIANHSGLKNKIRYHLQSKYDREFTATVENTAS